MAKISEAEVLLGDGIVTVRRKGVSKPAVANILGTELDASGRTAKIWLDRIVHRAKEDVLGEWTVSGVISTVLSR